MRTSYRRRYVETRGLQNLPPVMFVVAAPIWATLRIPRRRRWYCRRLGGAALETKLDFAEIVADLVQHLGGRSFSTSVVDR
jgi:hypothetical protein